jgi:hypothetical protein
MSNINFKKIVFRYVHGVLKTAAPYVEHNGFVTTHARIVFIARCITSIDVEVKEIIRYFM